MGIEKKGRRGNGIAEGQRGRQEGEGGGEGERRDIAVGASLVKLTGDITVPGVKNERDIKKISPVSLSAPAIEVDGSAT